MQVPLPPCLVVIVTGLVSPELHVLMDAVVCVLSYWSGAVLSHLLQRVHQGRHSHRAAVPPLLPQALRLHLAPEGELSMDSLKVSTRIVSPSNNNCSRHLDT